MSDVDDLYTDTDDDETGGQESDGLKDMRRAANKARKLEKENETLRRQLAFSQVPGLDVSDTKVQYFVKGYDGETTPDAILAAAREAGFVAPPAPDPAQVEQAAAEQRIQAVATGATPATGVTERDKLIQAGSQGGQDAVLAQLREMGIPISTDSY